MNFKKIYFIPLIVIVPVIFLVFKHSSGDSPESIVTKAGIFLTEAQLKKGDIYAKEEYDKARKQYDLAMSEWKNQNEKLIVLRQYNQSIEHANQSIEFSKKAIKKSKKAESKLEENLELRLKRINTNIIQFEKDFSRYPISRLHRDEFIKCKLLYSEAVQAHANNNYLVCAEKLDSIEPVFESISSVYKTKLKDYFKKFPVWNNEIEQTISSSKTNQTYAIVVDKYIRKLFIYRSGKKIKEYSIELGSNWVGDKNLQGDKSTPEGMYKVVKKLQNRETKYYKALLLNYPNDDDKKRFIQNKNMGLIKRDAKIGNLIEIHGHGGKGVDWTDGCIAVKDSDMNEIYSLCSKGTLVTIVGSTQAFNELNMD